MSPGMEVSLEALGETQGQASLKFKRGQASPEGLFSALMAMFMGIGAPPVHESFGAAVSHSNGSPADAGMTPEGVPEAVQHAPSPEAGTLLSCEPAIQMRSNASAFGSEFASCGKGATAPADGREHPGLLPARPAPEGDAGSAALKETGQASSVPPSDVALAFAGRKDVAAADGPLPDASWSDKGQDALFVASAEGATRNEQPADEPSGAVLLPGTEGAGFAAEDVIPNPTPAVQPQGRAEGGAQTLKQAQSMVQSRMDAAAVTTKREPARPERLSGFEREFPLSDEPPQTACLDDLASSPQGLPVLAFDATAPAPERESGLKAPAISLKSVRAVADLLREEAVKQLPRSVQFRLDPPELGKVTVLLSTRGQDVAVKFVVPAGEAQRALQEASGDLAQALSERGLSLTGFSVDQGAHGDKSQARQGKSGLFPRPGAIRRSSDPVAPARIAAFGGRGTAGLFDRLA